MLVGERDEITALVVDSDDEDREWITRTLEQSGIRVTSVSEGRTALDRLREVPYELLVVATDLEGGIRGLRVAKAAKWRWPKASIILTGRHPSLEAVIAGIELGVDAYVDKPSSLPTLEEKVASALSRQHTRCCTPTERHLLERQGLSLDKEARRVTVDDEPVRLTPTEFKILLHIMENAHRVVSPEELMEITHGEGYPDETATDIIRWHIHNLRKKIEPNPSRPRYVLNVHGAGYILGKQDTL